MDFYCPRCQEECTSYNEWLKKKEGEFNKQKKKYEKEINDVRSNSHSTYDKKFYNNLKRKYSSFEKFVETLKEGAYCTNGIIDGKIDFNKPQDIFSRSKYCASCPVFGVTCKQGDCKNITENSCDKIKIAGLKNMRDKEPSMNMNMLVSDNKLNDFPKDLENFCNHTGIFKGIRNDKWSCNYLCNLDVCQLNSNYTHIHLDKRVAIKVLYKYWLEYFLEDYNKIQDKISSCINTANENLCINKCKNKCECIEKWINLKSAEWVKIKKRYQQQYGIKDEDISNKVRSFLEERQFKSDIDKAKGDFKNLHELEESSKCTESVSRDNVCKKKDVITILLNRLKKKIETCKTQHDENKNNNSCKTLPTPLPRRRHQGRRRVVRSVRIRRPRPPPPTRQSVARSATFTPDTPPLAGGGSAKPPGPTVVSEEEEEEEDEEDLDSNDQQEEPQQEAVAQPEASPPATPGVKPPCDIVKEHFKDKHDKNGAIDSCNPKNYNGWTCQTDKFENGHSGACMPPRRIKLCVINLKYLNEKKSPEELRKAFIQCAAAETFFLWHKYKVDKEIEKKKEKTEQDGRVYKPSIPNELDEDLKKGTIPDDFKRQMFYTFGDYRDLCLDKDIGNDVSEVEKSIKRVFSSNGDKTPNGHERQKFWENYGEDIWHGMLCALTYKENGAKGIDAKIEQNKDLKGALLDDSGNKPKKPQYQYNSVKFSDNRNGPDLETFAKRPQFLRWFTEWSDEFCTERKKKEKKVSEDCKTDYDGCEKNKSGSCANACKAYNQYITNKKEEYD
ncbi:hypothetical protein PFAG_00565, partial [Plasmodium falciparum Santa Lucia]